MTLDVLMLSKMGKVMNAVSWRRLGGMALTAVLLAFAHPAAAEGLRLGRGLERRTAPADLRDDLREERRQGSRDEWLDHKADTRDGSRRSNNRLDARYDTDAGAGVRRLSADERRQLRRELQDAARELYGR